MTRLLPPPEALPARAALRYPPLAAGQGPRLAACGARAEAVLRRVYPEPGPSPHGWYDRAAFIARAREGDAWNRMFFCIQAQIVAKEIARGRLVLA